MRKTDEPRQMAVILLLGVTTIGALLLVGCGAPLGAVKDILSIVFPPIVALAASAVGGRNGGRSPRRRL
ncbi:MAG: hypothetical protein JWO56_134 [Acidobacteria bacterium]|nr:hypothetical protein [Acidobacteriota bacterium]